ncbi:MAG: histone deacetylase family protein [Thermodesulfobacteriota bacterium]|nr:histone deacetylase family protein [Thermodesulfobacteriota bacterium]
MKVIYHEDFNQEYCSDPAAASGRIEAVVKVIRDKVTFVEAIPAEKGDIAAVHSESHITYITRAGIYDISALAAGGAIQAAVTGLKEPCFALIRPPGHHASFDNAWGFCFFNNMVIAIQKLKREGMIKNAIVLDIDLHFGDGTVNLLGGSGFTTMYNPSSSSQDEYLKEVEEILFSEEVDMIGISAGFDNHVDDWGGLLSTSNYTEIGRMVRQASKKNNGGCFAILEGGYNHRVLGQNVMALIEGMDTKG